MSAEKASLVSNGLINNKSIYIESLRRSGFTLREVRNLANPFNAIVYQCEGGNEPQGRSNLLMLYAIMGEAGATSHISTSFLSELKSKVNTEICFNSALSRTSLEA